MTVRDIDLFIAHPPLGITISFQWITSLRRLSIGQTMNPTLPVSHVRIMKWMRNCIYAVERQIVILFDRAISG